MKLLNSKIIRLLRKCFLIFVLGGFYLKTIAPDLTWVNNGADGGDLITAAATGGVAHPTGYPVYLFVARLFQFIPLGSIAYRTNLLSAFCTILAAIILYDLVVRFLDSTNYNWLVGLIAAFAFGLSQLVWSQAVITEVYALQSLFIVLILYLLPLGEYKFRLEGDKLDSIRGLVFGLAMGNHTTAIFLLPPLLLVGVVNRNPTNKVSILAGNKNREYLQGWSINYRALLIRCTWILVGLSFYLTLFIRANSGSPVNWGNPSNLKNFIWLVTGKIYENLLFNFPYGFFLIKFKTWGSILLNQLGIVGLAIAIFGLIFNWKRSTKLLIVTGWMIAAFGFFSFIYNSTDSFVYLIFAVIALVLWLSLGIAKIIEVTKSFKPWLGIVFGFLFLTYFIGYGVQTLPKVDASLDNRAEQFGNDVMLKAPDRSIIFTDGDKDSFSLWYFQYVLNKRPDIAIIVTNLLPYPWYRETVRKTYLYLSVPDGKTNSWQSDFIKANPNRPICYTIVINEGSISCER